MYENFVKEKIEGQMPIRSPMKMRKLKTFTFSTKTVKTKVQEKIITLREDRSLLQRLKILILITSLEISNY